MAHIPDNGTDKPLSASILAIDVKHEGKKRKAVEDPICHTAYLSSHTLELERTLGPKTWNKVTFEVTDIKPENYYANEEPNLRKPQEVLEAVHSDARTTFKAMVHSSLEDSSRNSGTSDIVPDSHGFVGTVFHAWNRHFHLEIRPDDVWISIITQFSRFINANAERFRNKFVEFSGKENALVIFRGTRETFNYGLFAVETSKLLERLVVDPELREWIVPRFSTTTLDDTIASSIAIMSTLGHYFKYRGMSLCGIPSVTLHGEKRDWENLLKRIEKLKEFGLETTMWYHLLEPILKRFVKAWDDPYGEWNKQFWGRVVTGSFPLNEMCGNPTEFDGWLTAFMPFNDEGKWQLEPGLPELKSDLEQRKTTEKGSYPLPDDIHNSYYNLPRYDFMRKYNTSAMAYPKSISEKPDSRSTKDAYSLSVRYSEFGIDVLGVKLPRAAIMLPDSYWEKWATELGMPDGDSVRDMTRRWRYADPSSVDGDVYWSSTHLVIDGTWYPRGKNEELPSSICNVDVLFDEKGRTFESRMVAGVVGYHVNQITTNPHPASNRATSDEAISHTESSLQPQVGWWIYEKKTTAEMKKEWEADELRRQYQSDLAAYLWPIYGSEFPDTLTQINDFDGLFQLE